MDWLPCTQDPALDSHQDAGHPSQLLYQHHYQQANQQDGPQYIKQEESHAEVVAELVCFLQDGHEERQPIFAGLTLVGRKEPSVGLEQRKWACHKQLKELHQHGPIRELALQEATVSIAHALLLWRPAALGKRPQLSVMDLHSTAKTWVFHRPDSNKDNEYELHPGFMTTVPCGLETRLQFGNLCCHLLLHPDNAAAMPEAEGIGGLSNKQQLQTAGSTGVGRAGVSIPQMAAENSNRHVPDSAARAAAPGEPAAAAAAAAAGSSGAHAGSTEAMMSRQAYNAHAVGSSEGTTPAHSATQHSPLTCALQQPGMADEHVGGSLQQAAEPQLDTGGPDAGHSQSPGPARRRPSSCQGSARRAALDQQAGVLDDTNHHVDDRQTGAQQQQQQQQHVSGVAQCNGLHAEHAADMQPARPCNNVRLHSQPTLSEQARRQRAIDALEASDTEPSTNAGVPSESLMGGQPQHGIDHLHPHLHHKSRLGVQELQHTSSDEHHTDGQALQQQAGGMSAGGQQQQVQPQQPQAEGAAARQLEPVRVPQLRLPWLRVSGQGQPAQHNASTGLADQPATQAALQACPPPVTHASASRAHGVAAGPGTAGAAGVIGTAAADGTAAAEAGGAPWWLSTPTDDIEMTSQDAAPSNRQPMQEVQRQANGQEEVARPSHRVHNQLDTSMADAAAGVDVPSTLPLDATEVQAAQAARPGLHAVFKPVCSPGMSLLSTHSESELQSESVQDSPASAEAAPQLADKAVEADADGTETLSHQAGPNAPTAERKSSGPFLSLTRMLQSANGSTAQAAAASNPSTPNLRGFMSLGVAAPNSEARPPSGNQPWHVLNSAVAAARARGISPTQGPSSAAAFLSTLGSGNPQLTPPLIRAGSAAAPQLAQEPAGAVSTEAADQHNQPCDDAAHRADDVAAVRIEQQADDANEQQQQHANADDQMAVNRQLNMDEGVVGLDAATRCCLGSRGHSPAAGQHTACEAAGAMLQRHDGAQGSAAVPGAGGEWNTRKRRSRASVDGSSASGSSPAVTAGRPSGDGGDRSGLATPERGDMCGVAQPPAPVVKIEPLVIQPTADAVLGLAKPAGAQPPQGHASGADMQGLGEDILAGGFAPSGSGASGPAAAYSGQQTAAHAAADASAGVQDEDTGRGQRIKSGRSRPKLLLPSGNKGNGWMGRAKRSGTPPKQLQGQDPEYAKQQQQQQQQQVVAAASMEDPFAPPSSEPPPSLQLINTEAPSGIPTACQPASMQKKDDTGQHINTVAAHAAAAVPLITGGVSSAGKLVQSVLGSPDISPPTSPTHAAPASAHAGVDGTAAAPSRGCHSNAAGVHGSGSHQVAGVSQAGVSQGHSMLGLPGLPISGGSLLSATQQSGLAFQQVGGLINQLVGGPVPASGSDAAGPEHAITAAAQYNKQEEAGQQGAALVTGQHPAAPRPNVSAFSIPPLPSASAQRSPARLSGPHHAAPGRSHSLLAVADADSPSVSLPGQMTQAAALGLTSMANQSPKMVSPSQGQGAALGLVQLHHEQPLPCSVEDNGTGGLNVTMAADATAVAGAGKWCGGTARGSKAKGKTAGVAAAAGRPRGRGRGRGRGPGVSGRGKGTSSKSRSRTPEPGAQSGHAHAQKWAQGTEQMDIEDDGAEPPVVTCTQVLRSADALVAELHHLAENGLRASGGMDMAYQNAEQQQQHAQHVGRQDGHGEQQTQKGQVQQVQPSHGEGAAAHVAALMPLHNSHPTVSTTTTTHTGSSIRIKHSRAGALSPKEVALLQQQQQQHDLTLGAGPGALQATQQSPLMLQPSSLQQQATGAQHQQQGAATGNLVDHIHVPPPVQSPGAAAADEAADAPPVPAVPSRKTKRVTKPRDSTAAGRSQPQAPHDDVQPIDVAAAGRDMEALEAGAATVSQQRHTAQPTRKAGKSAKPNKASGHSMSLAVSPAANFMDDVRASGGSAAPSVDAPLQGNMPAAPPQRGVTPTQADDSVAGILIQADQVTPVMRSAAKQTGSKRKRNSVDGGARGSSAPLASSAGEGTDAAAGTNTARKRRRGPSDDGGQPQPQVYVRFSTAVAKADISKYKSIVQQLGGVVLNDKDPDTHLTHLVLPRDKFKRSINQLVALAQGAALVNEQWLEDSKRAGHWVSITKDHLGVDAAAEQAWSFNLWDSWQRRMQQGPLLTGVHVFATKKCLEGAPAQASGADNMHPYQKLVQAAGGIWLDKPQKLSTLLTEYQPSEFKTKVLVVGAEESKERRSGLPSGVHVYKKDVLLNSILWQQHVWLLDETQPEFTVRSG